MESILATLRLATTISFIGFFIYFTVYGTKPKEIRSKNVAAIGKRKETKIQLIRHATVVISTENKKILVDPMLGDVGTEFAYPLTSNRVKNPLIPLSVEKNELIRDIDAVLLTHYHPDHFDKEAEKILPKDTLIYCQPGDKEKLMKKGFKNVIIVDDEVKFGEIEIKRLTVNHGEGVWKKPMGKSSAYYLKTKENSIFITGDAIFDEQLKRNLKETQPDSIIANAGAAQFIIGEPITLTADGLKNIHQLLPKAKIIAIHMDTINHCKLTKEKLRKYIATKGLTKNINVPNEGDVL